MKGKLKLTVFFLFAIGLFFFGFMLVRYSILSKRVEDKFIGYVDAQFTKRKLKEHLYQIQFTRSQLPLSDEEKKRLARKFLRLTKPNQFYLSTE
ncbi:MAG: hypothetical protein NZO16_03550 [Deltaproteobacteria bacterium]|nr:hypothetical protein [Deltaproteobacteria bacterium]